MAHARSLLALVLAAAWLVGCAATETAGGEQFYRSARYAEARALYEAGLTREPRNTALDRNEAGVRALLAGDVGGAHRHFREAFDELDDLTSTTGETVGAFAGSAASRRWKGEPYERCMNAYYLGVTYWLLGDVDNAAASFRAGVLRDADSEFGAAQSDFALLWYLLGQAQRAARHNDGGETALRQAAALLPGHPQLATGVAGGSVLVLVETGSGPRKVAAGPGGAWLRFNDRGASGLVPRVSVEGGQTVGDAGSLGDVYKQAVTRGEKNIDHVNQGKAVLQQAAVVTGAVIAAKGDSDRERLIGAGIALAGLAMATEADTRQWRSLPREVFAVTVDLPPGQHSLRIEFLERGGRADPSLTRVVPVTVRPGRVSLCWARAVPAPVASRAGP